MKRICPVSNKEFEILPDDLKFYDRLGLTPPTLSPLERMRRRLCYRNERRLYRRKCSATQEMVVSMYSPEKNFPVYENDFWWSDSWDARSYGREFDFKRPFFDQFFELVFSVPKMARIQQGQNENSKYTNCASYNRNCYLISGNRNEDCLYATSIVLSKDCIDCLSVSSCELAYSSSDCSRSYQINYCTEVHGSHEMEHCFDCRNCSNCFCCAGLRGKSYCVLNVPMERSEYESILNDPIKKADALAKYQLLKTSVPRLYTSYVNCENFSGSYLVNCKNVSSCWNCLEVENAKYCANIASGRDLYDVNYYGATGLNELLCDCVSVGNGAYRVFFSAMIWGGSSDVSYSYECFSSQRLFGCSGIRKAENCIFNRQYLKHEYDRLEERIISHMKETGEWGEFFPAKFSPFGYNETMAFDYLPLAKSEVLALGLHWREDEPQIFRPEDIYQGPTEISLVGDDILDKLLICRESGRAFKVVRKELEFYRKQKLPIPSLSPEVRHQQRNQQRNPRLLFQRKCGSCGIPRLSPYSPDRGERILCEDCYLKIVH